MNQPICICPIADGIYDVLCEVDGHAEKSGIDPSRIEELRKERAKLRARSNQ